MGWSYPHKPIMGWPIDPDHPLSDFVSFWPMHEGSGNKVFDLSRYGNDGTISSGLSWIPGKFGSALESSGGDNPVTIVDNPILRITGPMTVVVWIRIDVLAISPWRGIISRYGSGESDRSWMLVIPNTTSGDYVEGRVNFLVSSNGIGVDTAINIDPSHITLGKYHQIIARYDGSTIKLFLDGIEESSRNYALGLYGDPEPVRIFQYETSAATLDGAIDNASIYNRALSSGEIAELYSNPFCMFKDPAEIALLGAYVEEEVEGIVVLRRRRESA